MSPDASATKLIQTAAAGEGAQAASVVVALKGIRAAPTALLLGLMIAKVIARWAWDFRAPEWLDFGMAVALIVVLFYAMRQSKESRVL